MATQIGLYNAALDELEKPRLASLSETVEARRVLDGAYQRVVADCLEAGQWNFAIRTIRAEADANVTPEFGYPNVFGKPADWVRTIALSLDERFADTLSAYDDDVNFWSADTTPIFIRYVSNEANWGLNLSIWPASFTRYVELELAHRVSGRLGASGNKKDEIGRDRDKAKKNALNKDAMNNAQPRWSAPGSWTLSRGGRRGRGDLGRTGSLTG